MDAKLVEEFKEIPTEAEIPGKFSNWASRLRKKKPEELEENEKEFLEAYNLKLSESSTYYKNVTEYRTNKKEVNENSVQIAGIEAGEKHLKRLTEFANEAFKAGKEEYPTIIKKLHKVIDTLMSTIAGQASYISQLQSSSIEHERARLSGFHEVLKLKEKSKELEQIITNKENEEEGFTKLLESENIDKIKGLLETVKAIG